ncbi:MAG: Elongation factor Ts [Parcubacteria group bacterium GW2011_GWC1_42_11]|uniref:Elongation factor Ts n=1 Tax=Candidatus Nomurabacteria bacterium GW2011_GWC2_42_20 TaxID=1618756 RepID=A0A0G1BLG0_9BACT|nr:MAG: Elongation factor Ts [Parcubacteria group bacterium GW2011_GWC1_42_11]KKS47101.1 MAG: Elongation factor Ts [Candidatus Nomurabacteria bacterium GW2011_GWC2_42_20]KKT09187.1 MAG: Elongation factor Ts [Candidatus Nomurabacteria bacterium GW2011_GWB1_43_20]
MITTEQIKELRELTGISVMQCKKALEEASGDKEKALLILRKKSGDIATKKGDRELGAGIIESYIHSNKSVGALVELSCETDFVARNEEFVVMARDIAMHITATNPQYLDETEITEDVRAKVIDMFKKEVEESDKPAEIKEKMMEGKLAGYFGERTLLAQAFVKNPDITIKQLIDGGVQKFGEKIAIARFSRFAVAK